MSVTRPKTQVPGQVFVGPSDKEIADLQVKKATLQNEVDGLNIQINTLASKKADIEKEIQKEKEIYDQMGLTPYAELQGELEKKISEHKDALEVMENELIEINSQVEIQDQKSIYLKSENEKLDVEISLKRNELNVEVVNFQDELSILQNKIVEANLELVIEVDSVEKARQELVKIKKDGDAEFSKLASYKASLERKSRDLAIWEKRLTPIFKELHPDEEMKFI